MSNENACRCPGSCGRAKVNAEWIERLSRGGVAAVLALATAPSLLTARAQSRPGDMTQAHVWIENRSGNEAIPVVVQRSVDPLQVQVAGRPTVTIDPSSTIGTRAVRQQWEYRA